MTSTEKELTDCRMALDALAETATACGDRWSEPVSKGKWSPAQIVEHVARAFEENANDLSGKETLLPSLPAPLRFIARKVVFDGAARKGTLPRAKTNKAMNPANGPETPEAGRARLDEAWATFAAAVEAAAEQGDRARSSVFGEVDLPAFVRFQAVHTRHHEVQFARS